MSALAVTNTFVSGAVITAAGHNTNFSDIVTWANGNISNTNFGTMTGVVTWNVTTNALGINSTNTGTEGSVTIAHNGTLASGKSGLKITSNAAQSAGTAIVEITTSSISSNIPALLITDAGTGSPAFKVVSTTKPSHPAPSMTTTQRNALTSMAAGDEIWNITNVRKEIYDGSNWVASSGQTGQIVDYAGSSIPAHMLLCDGSSLLRASYPALFAAIGTTWGAADGTHFNIPDLRGRATIGDGTGSGLTARTLADILGGETLPAHTHTGSTNTDGGHTHGQGVNTGGSGNPNYALPDDGGGPIYPGATNSTGSTHSHAFTTNSTGTGSHGVMQPSAVVKKCIVI